jgi:hypothetical protein
MLQDKRDTSLLGDPGSTAHQQPHYAQNWHRSIEPEHLVVVGICTHLGCIPKLEAQVGGSFGANWPGGYFCPCHGSKYDLAGRVFSGVPEPYNLPVPPYHFVSKTAIRIGENPLVHNSISPRSSKFKPADPAGLSTQNFSPIVPGFHAVSILVTGLQAAPEQCCASGGFVKRSA